MIKLLTDYQNRFSWITEEKTSSKLIVFENYSFALSEEKISKIRTFRDLLHQNLDTLDEDTLSLFQKLQTHIKECIHKSFSERTSSGGD